MKISILGRYALGVFATGALLAGCSSGGSQQPDPSGVIQNDAQPAAKGVHADRSRSWMAPDAKKNDLLYISDLGTDDVYAYSYPSGELKGTLTGFHGPWGECVDKAGDVFITNASAFQILEFAHGGTSPIATLSDPNQYPVSCSIDPTTGNLAVANQESTNGFGSVSIYAKAQGMPTIYKVPGINQCASAAYDARGNLFVDGVNGFESFKFAELSRGRKTFTNITLNHRIRAPGGIQWDGKYVAIGDPEGNTIYQFTVSGSRGTEVGSTSLDGSDLNIQFWIHHHTIISPNFLDTSVMFWNYPAGGTATKTLSGFSQPIGATVSKGE
jgi:hypothetical protein